MCVWLHTISSMKRREKWGDARMSKKILILIVVLIIAFLLFFSCLEIYAQSEVKVSEKRKPRKGMP